MGEGLIPGSLRSVYKHHRLTLQQTHQNIWAKPQAMCNPSSGRAPKRNLLSNHPSTSVVGSVPPVQTLYCFQIELTQVVVACLSKPRQVCVTNAPVGGEEDPKHSGLVRDCNALNVLRENNCDQLLLVSMSHFFWATPEQSGIVRWVTEAFGQTTKCYSIWLHLPPIWFKCLEVYLTHLRD